MVTIGGAESAPPRGKEDILKAVGIRVKGAVLLFTHKDTVKPNLLILVVFFVAFWLGAAPLG